MGDQIAQKGTKTVALNLGCKNEERIPYHREGMAWPVLVCPLVTTPFQKEAIMLSIHTTGDGTPHPGWTWSPFWDDLVEQARKEDGRS